VVSKFHAARQRFRNRPPRESSGQVDRFNATGTSAARSRAPRPWMGGGARKAQDERPSASYTAASAYGADRVAASSARDVRKPVAGAGSSGGKAWNMVQLPPRSLGVTRRYPRVPQAKPGASTSYRQFPNRQIPNPPVRQRRREVSANYIDDFPLPRHVDARSPAREASHAGLLIALAAVLLVVAGFAAFSLTRGIGSTGDAASHALEAASTEGGGTHGGLAATATSYALTPTVTTGLHTPTPTPRPRPPTQSPVLIPTATPNLSTPTPTLAPPTPTDTPPTPTDTPVPPTATPVPPTATPTP
jgi:hypothetical protein